jgi:N utilization substance protein B
MPRAASTDARRQARVLVLQSLYAADLQGREEDGSLDWLAAEEAPPARAVAFARLLRQGVQDNRSALDRIIQRYAPAWPIHQLSPVDRNILRLALFELLANTKTPGKTAINEAVELAKAFGSESSPRFINGVLGSVMNGLESGELEPIKPTEKPVEPVAEGR